MDQTATNNLPIDLYAAVLAREERAHQAAQAEHEKVIAFITARRAAGNPYLPCRDVDMTPSQHEVYIDEVYRLGGGRIMAAPKASAAL